MSQPSRSLGLSAQRLERIEAFLSERYVAPGRLAGALTLVHRRGETAYLSVQGLSDIERKKPLGEDTIFRIYSMTKPITTLALMMLVEEAKIQLDDPVHRYIPEWRNLSVYAGGTGEPGAPFRSKPVKRAMQVVDLLRHTSGLTYGIQQQTNLDAAYRARGIGVLEDRQKGKPLGEMVADLAKLPLEFSPGDAWNYSVSIDVAGYLIEQVSGVPFAEFLHKRIFEPLGMKDTGFHVPAEKKARFAACYTVGRNGLATLQDDPQTSPYLELPRFYSGGGGLVSTAGDYLAFCRLMLGGGALGGERLVSPTTVELMTKNHLPGGKTLAEMSISLFSEASYAGVGFGLGFAVTVDPAASLIAGTPGEYFWGGAASTYFFIDPKQELIVIFMTQLLPSTFYNLRRELRSLVYSSLVD